MDPLATPLAKWDDQTLTALIGRRENDLLEVKGPDLDVSSRGGRQKVAEGVAGLTSNAGGLLALGADEQDHVLRGLPGLLVDEDEWQDARRSVLDRVRPSPVFADRLFPVAGGRNVIVLQVRPHPAGLPAAADGVFRVRVGEETRQMGWDEVRRRFQAAASRLEVATKGAEDALSAIGLLDSRMMALFEVAIVPMAGPLDLGTTAEDLRIAFQRLAAIERPIWEETICAQYPEFRDWHLEDSDFVSRSTGLLVSTRSWICYIQHDGTVAFGTDAVGDHIHHLQTPEFALFTLRAFTSMSRFLGFGLAIQRDLGLAGSAMAVAHSGRKDSKVMGEGGVPLGLPSTDTAYARELPVRGGSLESADFVKVMVRRIRDSTGDPSVDLVYPAHAEYLIRMQEV